MTFEITENAALLCGNAMNAFRHVFSIFKGRLEFTT